MASPRVSAGIDFDARPLLVFWETTKACLLSCRHCRAEAIPDPLPGELSPGNGLVISGLSKESSMTGWRIGTTVAPLPIAKAISELQSQMSSNVTTFAQFGALAALKEKEKTTAAVQRMLVAFDRRRKSLHAELNRIAGIKCLLAEGAFYLFPNISSFEIGRAHV